MQGLYEKKMLSCKMQNEVTAMHFVALVQQVFQWNITKKTNKQTNK